MTRKSVERGASTDPASYDMTAAIGLVRAAERQKSPAILQLFPITVKYGGGPFLRFCLDL